MLGAPPKPAMREVVTVEELPSRSICRVEPMNMSQAYNPAVWQKGAVGAQRPVAPGEIDVRTGANVVLHPDLAAEAMDLLHPARFDRRDQRGMRIEREVCRDLPLQSQTFAVRREQQLDGGGVEADAVVQPPDAIRRVDALDRQHGGEDLRFGDVTGVAREQRLNVERLSPTSRRSRRGRRGYLREAPVRRSR